MSTLTNSIVRGFGLTLGRKAANAVTAPRQSQKSVETVSFSKKQQELITKYEDILKGLVKLDNETEGYKTAGTITENEYLILKSQINEQVSQTNTELEKVKSVKESGSIWPTLIGVVIGIYAVLWMLKAIKGL